MQKKMNNKHIVWAFALFFGWILSLPYEGPVMYGLAADADMNGKALNLLTVLFHLIGLFSARYIITTQKKARAYGTGILVLCLVGSLMVPVVPVDYWIYLLPLLSLLAGMFVTSYGHFIKAFVAVADRTMAVADMLIYSNIVLMAAHMMTTFINPMTGFVFIIGVVLLNLYLFLKIPMDDAVEKKAVLKASPTMSQKAKFQIYGVFCLFIFIITLNSGIMFQVIYPYFFEYEGVASIYTNIPYIATLFLLSRAYGRINKAYMLYVGLVFWGLSFIVFALAPWTLWIYLLVNTIMLSACGIFDLFWWSIMGDLFEYTENPASTFGLGLSMNVFGVWIGGILGNTIMALGASNETLSFLGIGVMMASMLILIPLNQYLSELLIDNAFIVRIEMMKPEEISEIKNKAIDLLTEREKEVLDLLLEGYTNAAICEQLYISINTLKTHNRNIYKKLEVKNKVELVEVWKAQ